MPREAAQRTVPRLAPLGIELSDVFITLTLRDAWTKGDTQDELVEAMSVTLGPARRPLATVLIGGMITSTLATLLVLPTLYAGFARARAKEVAEPPEPDGDQA